MPQGGLLICKISHKSQSGYNLDEGFMNTLALMTSRRKFDETCSTPAPRVAARRCARAHGARNAHSGGMRKLPHKA